MAQGDVSPFQEVDLVVRVHAASIASTGSIIVRAEADGFTLEDPAQSFLADRPATPPSGATPAKFGGVTIDSGSPAGTYLVTALTGGLGRYIAVAVVASMPSGRGSLSATISVELALKGGDPSGMTPSFNSYRGYR